MQSRTAIFSNLAKDFMRRVRLAVPAGTRLGDTVERMSRDDASSVIVTGASSGIGRETAREFARAGSNDRDGNGERLMR